MPGPSSPKRQAKQQQAKAKAKEKGKEKEKEEIENLIPPAGFKPPEGSIVYSLPHNLTDEGRAWWNKWAGAKGDFEGHKANKGSPYGAMGWVRQKFVKVWWEVHFPEALDTSSHERAWFFRESGIGRLIYAHLDNWAKRKESGEERQPKPAEPKLKTKAYGHDEWRKENPAVYKQAIDTWKEQQEREPNFGEARALSSAEFKKLPTAEQKQWKAKAKAALKQSRALAKITDPEDRAKFLDEFVKTYTDLTKQAAEIAGIQVCALVLHEKDNGAYHIRRELTEGIRGFSKSPALVSLMGDLQKFIETSVGKSVENPFPKPTVYPDYTKANFPTVPNFVGWRLKELRELLRLYMKAVFRFQGAVGRLIWKEIKAAINHWFDPRRLPENAEWDDPSLLALPMVIVWLEFIVACQTGKVPPERRFQFLRVPAGPTPIHPSDSQEARRELVESDGKRGYCLVFEDTVTKCHQVGGMTYPKDAIAFADLLASGDTHADAITAPPKIWKGLPSASPSIPTSVIFGAEKERIVMLASLLPDTGKNRIISAVDAVNDYQAHLPASHSKGIWLKDGPPLAIPQSPVDSDTSDSMWLPICYFQPPGMCSLNGTMYWLELWQTDLLTSDLIRHEPSKTFYGGKTGVVHVIRVLIRVYLNCCAIRGDFNAPEDPPSTYDLSRFNVNDHDRIAKWLDDWTLELMEYTAILSETSDERKRGLAAIPPALEDDSGSEEIPNHPSAQPIAAPESSKSTNRTRGSPGPSKPKGSKRKPRGRTNLRDLDQSQDSDQSCDPGVNFDDLDKSSQDDASSDNEGWGLSDRRHDERHDDDDDDDDDDIFPPDDSLGVYTRYRVNPDAPRVIIDAFADVCRIDEDDAWTETDFVFGEPPELDPYKAPRLTRPETAMRQLLALELEAKRARENWEYQDGHNPRLTPAQRKQSQEDANPYPEPLRPLVRAVILRRIAWLRARALSRFTFKHWEAMAYILREAVHLFDTTQRIIEHNVFPDPALSAQDLVDQVAKSKREVIELRYACVELKSWHKLSTEHYNKLKASWLFEEMPRTLGELATIGEGLMEWADDTYELGQALVKDRRSRWEKLFDIPYEASTPNMTFLFGCPSSGEEPKGLEAAIRFARSNSSKELAHASPSTSLDDNGDDVPSAQNSPVHASSPSAVPDPAGPNPVITDVPPAQDPPVPASSPPAAPDPAGPDPVITDRPRARPKMRPPPPVEPASSPQPNPAGEPNPSGELNPTGDVLVPQIIVLPPAGEAAGEPNPAGEGQGMDLDQDGTRLGTVTPTSSDAPSLADLHVVPRSSVEDEPNSPLPDPPAKPTTRKRKSAPDSGAPLASKRVSPRLQPSTATTEQPVATGKGTRVQPRRAAQKKSAV